MLREKPQRPAVPRNDRRACSDYRTGNRGGGPRVLIRAESPQTTDETRCGAIKGAFPMNREPDAGTVSPGAMTATQSELMRAFHRGFEVVLADTQALREEVFRLRYQVYCVENAYEDPAENLDGMETDAFDERSVHALLRHKPTGLCAGALRLVMANPGASDARFPLEVFCAGGLNASDRQRMASIPRGHAAEISRFAISKAFRRRFAEHLTTTGITEQNLFGDVRTTASGEVMRRATSHLTIGLFCGLVRLATAHEINYLYAVLEPSLLRLLERFGIRFERLGVPIDYHGRRQCAVASLTDLVEGVRAERPEIWTLAMQAGRGDGAPAGRGT